MVVHTSFITDQQLKIQPVNDLPDTVATLVIDKSADAVTINASPAKSLVIRDSLFIDSGTFNFGANF